LFAAGYNDVGEDDYLKIAEAVAMANKNVFQTSRGAVASVADTVNDAGGVAYAMTPQHALAQMAST
jgi:hypothetical protein